MIEFNPYSPENRQGITPDGVDMQLWHAMLIDQEDIQIGDTHEARVTPREGELPAQLDLLYGKGKAERLVSHRRADGAPMMERIRGYRVATNQFKLVSEGIVGIYRGLQHNAVTHSSTLTRAELKPTGAPEVIAIHNEAMTTNIAGKLMVEFGYSYDEEYPSEQNLRIRINLLDHSIGRSGISPAVVLDLARIGNFGIRQTITRTIEAFEDQMLSMQTPDQNDPTIITEERGLIFGFLSHPDQSDYPHARMEDPKVKAERTNAFYSFIITAFDRMAYEYKQSVREVDPNNPILKVPYRLLRNQMALGFLELAEASWMPDYNPRSIIDALEDQRLRTIQEDQLIETAKSEQFTTLMDNDEEEPTTDESIVVTMQLQRRNIHPWKTFFEIARERVKQDTHKIMEDELDIDRIGGVIVNMKYSDNPLEREVFAWTDRVYRRQMGDRSLPISQRMELNHFSKYGFDSTVPVVRIALLLNAISPKQAAVKPWVSDYRGVIDAISRLNISLFTNNRGANLRNLRKNKKDLGIPASRVSDSSAFLTNLDLLILNEIDQVTGEAVFPLLREIAAQYQTGIIINLVRERLSRIPAKDHQVDPAED